MFQEWARKVTKRTGVEIHWVFMPILCKLRAHTATLGRGVHPEEALKVCSIKQSGLDALTAAGILETQPGFWYYEVDGGACSEGIPCFFYKLSSRFEEILGWRFDNIDA